MGWQWARRWQTKSVGSLENSWTISKSLQAAASAEPGPFAPSSASEAGKSVDAGDNRLRPALFGSQYASITAAPMNRSSLGCEEQLNSLQDDNGAQYMHSWTCWQCSHSCTSK